MIKLYIKRNVNELLDISENGDIKCPLNALVCFIKSLNNTANRKVEDSKNIVPKLSENLFRVYLGEYTEGEIEVACGYMTKYFIVKYSDLKPYLEFK